MKIYLVGISCVGKTTIGRLLADYLSYSFYDLDNERKKYLKKIIVDLNYFKKSLSRADLHISIENISLTQIPELIVKEPYKINSEIMPANDK